MQTHTMAHKSLIGLLLLLTLSSYSQARIPEPDAILYGTAILDSTPLTASDTHVRVQLKYQGSVLATYTMGEHPEAGAHYVLRVPLDALEPRAPNTARSGDTASLVIVANDVEHPVVDISLGAKGSITRLDLDATDSDGDGLSNTADPDDDGDGLPDGFEIAQGFNPLDPADALADSDFDGRSNLQEFADGTNPHNFDSDGDGVNDGNEIADGRDPNQPDVRVALQAGLNMVTFPVLPALTSTGVLQQLGDKAFSIARLDANGGILETTTMVDGAAEGPDFPITAGEGYLIEMLEPDDVLWSGPFPSPSHALQSGRNLVGFPDAPQGLTAYMLLQTLGDADAVVGLQRFNADTGRFETATYVDGQPAGVNFPIEHHDAYLIAMRQAMPDVQLPQAPALAINSPAPNTTVDTPVIEVSGTVNDPQAQVTVGDVVASVGGGTFVAADVPLALGLNILTAVAEDTQGLRSTAFLLVFRQSSP